MVDLLLEYGADPDVTGDSEWTSLHYAAENGHDGIVQLLLDHWADPDAENKQGKTPLDIALGRMDFCVAKLLVDAKNEQIAEGRDGDNPFHNLDLGEIVRPLTRSKVAISQQVSRKDI